MARASVLQERMCLVKIHCFWHTITAVQSFSSRRCVWEWVNLSCSTTTNVKAEEIIVQRRDKVHLSLCSSVFLYFIRLTILNDHFLLLSTAKTKYSYDPLRHYRKLLEGTRVEGRQASPHKHLFFHAPTGFYGIGNMTYLLSKYFDTYTHLYLIQKKLKANTLIINCR